MYMHTQSTYNAWCPTSFNIFFKVFNTRLYPFFQYNSSLKVILFLQASFRIHESIITATATHQEQSGKELTGSSLSTITFEVGGLSPSKSPELE